jgi:dipeptidyl aminopeptidase/acylaminoacyl peptidase
MKNIVILSIFAVYTVCMFSQEEVSKANFQLADNWTPEKQFDRIQNLWTKPIWVVNSNIFVYQHVNDSKYNYFIVNPEKKTNQYLFNKNLLCSQLERKLDTNLDQERLQLHEIEIYSDTCTIEFRFNNQKYSYNTSEDILLELPRIDKAPFNELSIISPDGKYNLISRDNNLFYYRTDHPNRDTIQVDNMGHEYYSLSSSNIHWSPDSRYIAFIREDWNDVKDLWLINHYSNPRPVLKTFKWPMTGEAIEQYELWIYDTEKRKLLRANTGKWTDQTLEQLKWAHDSKAVYVQRMSRDWMSLDLCSVNPFTGECIAIIEERGRRQIITRLPYHLLKSTGEILWWSWRDGWNHYYLYDNRGRLINQITHGDYNTGKVIKIDEANRIVYFMANGKEPNRNPYYHHLYKISLIDNNQDLLTPEDAEHEIYFSETGDYFVDNFSRADLAPKAVVRNNEGMKIMELENADITPLEDQGWHKPDIFNVKAADDSTDIWGVIFKPFDFSPEKKYPIITYGYPGKETEFLPWRFYHNGWVTVVATSLAQYGFIVVVAGNRGGSPERSYSYYNYGENNFRDYPVADKKVVIKRLAEMNSYIDINKVGIMGQSSGGFMAATAILLEPDFFKVAVAKCGPQDPALYYHHWAERYLTVTETRDSNGKVSFNTTFDSNNKIVNNLKGRLLLIHGDMDLHVPPSLTYRLSYDLMMANKRFDMFIIPNADHFWGDNYPYVIKYSELYFVENLLGDNTFNVNMFEP